MLSKNQIKFINSLSLKKNRNEEGIFVAEGVKILEDLLASDFELTEIFATKDWIANNSTINTQIKLHEVSEEELKKISELKTPNKVLALAKIPKQQLDISSLKNKLVIGLEDIQDPGNLGTIIRLCDWFGIENIIANNNTVDCFNTKVIQASMGSIARINVHYCNLAETVKILKQSGKSVYATTLSGENIYTSELNIDAIILLGNEGNGLSKEIQQLATHNISIPNFSLKLNKADSLNVAIATSIICSEFKRR